MLLDGLGEGSLQSTAYPTAWAAMLRSDGALVFPAALRWLVAAQRSDGSWGAGMYVAHDRAVSTLAAIVALAAAGSQPGSGPRCERCAQAVAAGCAYMRRCGDDWGRSGTATAGFELVVPRLLREARAFALALPYAEFGDLELIGEEKLRRIPVDRAFREPTSLLYSLEALDGLAEYATDVRKLVSADGSLACSISSSAAFWMASGDPAVLAYLRLSANADGGFPEFHPLEVFERLWVLDNLRRAGLGSARREPLMRWLRALVHDNALLGHSASFPVPDADDTAMALSILLDAGDDANARLPALLAFEREDAFATYPHEIGRSTTPNARVLSALRHRPEAFAPQIAKLVDYLMDARDGDGGWLPDKWHASALYATATVLGALAPVAGAELAATARWLIDTQDPGGSWGADDGTAEETAYAALALDTLAEHGHCVPHTTWQRAASYLHAHLDETTYPELWLAKALYTPVNVVRSAILAGCARASARSSAYVFTTS
jgi:halimadienyl-diphosphate synthase